MQIHVVVIDGHTLTRYGLAKLIRTQADIDLVGEADSMSRAAKVVLATQPDVVITDVALPDGDGLRLAREFRDRRADLGIVVLTSRGEDDTLFRAMETGASAFVAKSAPVEEILGAIRHSAVAASSFTAAALPAALARRRRVNEQLALSSRESQALRLLSAGMSLRAIADSMLVSQSTAKTYVARLYDKLGASNRAQALMTAVRHGLLHSGAEC